MPESLYALRERGLGFVELADTEERFAEQERSCGPFSPSSVDLMRPFNAVLVGIVQRFEDDGHRDGRTIVSSSWA